MPARCSSTVQADLTRGKRGREGSPRTKKYEHRGPKRGHDLLKTDRTDRASQERVQYQMQGHQGYYFTNNSKLQPCVDDGWRLAYSSKR